MYIEMLDLLDASLHKKLPNPISEDAWPEIYRELRAHTVHCLIAPNIQYISMKDKTDYIISVSQNISIFHTIMMEQERVINCLEKADIEVVVLKGAAAAMYYPKPEFRCMGDIDIIVAPESFRKAFVVLKSSGYNNLQTLDNYHRHIVFIHNSIEIELHEFFSTSDKKEYNTVLNQYIYEGIRKREYKNIKGFRFPILPWIENGLVLLSHINHHLSTGIGLRQIVDWMCYVEKELSDDKWPVFSLAAREVGLKKLAIVTTAMCKKYLGLTGVTWCDNVDLVICDNYMSYVLNHGNFGRKIKIGDINTVSVIRRMKNPINGLKYAQRCGCQTWTLLESYPFLKPFAWIYQLTRWIIHGHKHGISVTSVRRYSNMEQNETRLLEELGITKYR